MSLFIKKHQIFISSTYTDLIEERSKIIELILNLYEIPIGMEMFSADNDEQWKTIQNTIDNSDYYLLIIGHRYGSLTNEGISYTEKEFDYAKKIGKPILTYVRENDVPTLPHQREEDPQKKEKLAAFIDKVLGNSMSEFWRDKSDLSTKVAIALPKTFKTSPTLGWVRSDHVNSSKITEELTKLSQENRELREEVEKLRALQDKKKIDFEISVTIPELQVPARLKFQKNTLSKIKKIEIENVPQKYKDTLNLERFEEYNQLIHEKMKTVHEYNRDLEHYETIHNNLNPIALNIHNIGNIKANDIHIDIFFPKEVLVVDRYGIRRNRRPKNPIDIENPLETLLNNEIFEKNPILEKISKDPILNAKLFPKTNSTLDSIAIELGNKPYTIDKLKNMLSFKIRKISHTRFYEFNQEIYLVPNQTGFFYAEAHIICDELKTTIVRKIKLNITENQES